MEQEQDIYQQMRERILDSILSDLDAIENAQSHETVTAKSQAPSSPPSNVDACRDNEELPEHSKSDDDTQNHADMPALEIVEEEYEKDEELSTWQYLKAAYLNKHGVASFLYSLSFYATYASWIMFALFIIGHYLVSPTITIIGIVGSMTCVFASIAGDEIARKLMHRGRAAYGVVVIIAAIFLFGMGSYGLLTADMEFISGGVLGMFVLSFVPWVLDSAGIPASAQPYHPVRHSEGGGGYNVLGETLGIPQPKEPPPIEISRDDDLDEEWRTYLGDGIEVSLPNVNAGTIIDTFEYERENPHVLVIDKLEAPQFEDGPYTS